MPISITAARWLSAFRRSSISGTPMSLLKLPLCGKRSILRLPGTAGWTAIICVTVVLPLLPVTRDQRQAELRAPARWPGAPSASQAVGHFDAGQTGCLQATARAMAAAAPPGASVRKEGMCVKTLTFAAPQTDRPAAGCACRCAHAPAGVAPSPTRRAAGIRGCSSAQACCSVDDRVQWCSCPSCVVPPRALQRSDARGPYRRTARRTPAVSWVVFVALARNQHHVGAHRLLASANGRWRPHGRARRAPLPPAIVPCRIWCRMAAGRLRCGGCRWSPATWSAWLLGHRRPSAGACPHRGRRRSQTRTTAARRALAARGRRACRALLQSVGGVGVVHGHQGLTGPPPTAACGPARAAGCSQARTALVQAARPGLRSVASTPKQVLRRCSWPITLGFAAVAGQRSPSTHT
jgi:hypothetical protein